MRIRPDWVYENPPSRHLDRCRGDPFGEVTSVLSPPKSTSRLSGKWHEKVSFVSPARSAISTTVTASSPHRLIASFREQLQGGEDEALASPRRRAGFAEPRPNRRSARTGRRACFYGFLLRERWSAFSAPSTGGEGTTPCAGERTASHNGVAPSR